jgi:LPS-assembly lipoprotein
MRFLTLIIATLMLAACGFHPLYAPPPSGASSMQAALNTIAIDNIPDREGLYLRNQLIDRFYKTGEPTNPIYKLSLSKIEESKEGLDITVDEESTRAQLRQKTLLTLTRVADHEVVLTRTLYNVASYNILKSQYTTRVSEDNARLNAINDLARQVEQAIVLYLQQP